MRASHLLPLLSTIAGNVVHGQGFRSQYGEARHQETVAVVADAGGITSVVRDASVADGPVRTRLLHTTAQGGSPQWHDVAIEGSCFVQGGVAAGSGLLLCGSCIRPGRSDHDAFVAEVSATGAVLTVWMSDTPDQEEQLLGLQRTTDGGAIAAGVWRGPADRDAWLVRLGPSLAPMWERRYGTGTDELLRSVTANGGGFVAVGRTAGFDGDRNTYVLRTDADGNEEWWHAWGGEDDDELFDIVDNGSALLAAGHTDTYGIRDRSGRHLRNVYVMAMESGGDTLWTRAYGDTLVPNAGRTLALAQNGDLLIGGVRGPEDPTEALVMRATASGTLLWQRTYAEARSSEVQDIRGLPDNGFLFGGRCFGPLSGQAFLVKADAQGD